MSYLEKDKLKFAPCNKIISRGVKGSSSYNYATNPELYLHKDLIANPTDFEPTDIVGISSNGNRRGGRKKPDFELIYKAAEARVTFITDNKANRERPYNIGEREVAEFLYSLGYVNEDSPEGAVWWYNG
jgi:hypothetical protein